MRISRPRNWIFMSDKEKQEWAEKTGKAIEESKKIIEQKMKELVKTGEWPKPEPPEPKSGMRWFPGGKF